MNVQPSAIDLERSALNINPGGWAVDHARPIATLLGSCVAVCLYDTKLKVGGMNHFLLPTRMKGDYADTDVVLAGDFAMEVLVNAMLGKGAQKSRMIAKAFGGGTIVTAIKMPIGARNAAFAKDWLEREGITLVGSDLGGPWARKVVWATATGDAFCRRIPISQSGAQAVVKAEMDYEQTLIAP